jgi:hypothetical protein
MEKKVYLILLIWLNRITKKFQDKKSNKICFVFLFQMFQLKKLLWIDNLLFIYSTMIFPLCNFKILLLNLFFRPQESRSVF